MSSYPCPTQLPGCASDGALTAMPVDLDNDTEDEELEDSYGHDSGHGMAMQQDDPDRNRNWPSITHGIAEPDEQAYFGKRCRCVSLIISELRIYINLFDFSSKD